MKLISIAIFICAFFLLRPYQLQQAGMLYSGDDDSYLAHATSLAFGQFPSYEKEHFTDGKHAPLHSIGSGIMASPFVFLFSLIDRVQGKDIALRRDTANLKPSWTLFGFVFATNVYFWFACFFIYKGLRYFFDSFYASLAVIFMVLCQGLPLFALRRPVYSHIYELFLQGALFYLLIRAYKGDFLNLKGYWQSIMLGGVIALVFLVRLNNFFVAVVWPIIIFMNSKLKTDKKRLWQRMSVCYLVFLVCVFFLKIIPDFFAQNRDYDRDILVLSTLAAPLFYLKRALHILLGLDWGLVFTAPFALIAVLGLCAFKIPFRKQVAFCLLPLLINFYIIIMERTQGGEYGYRYFVTSLLPLLAFPLAFLIQRSKIKFGNKAYLAWGLVAFIPFISMLAFQGNDSNLTLSIITQYFGFSGWGNNTYQLEVWKTLILYPVEFVKISLKGGPLYLFYLIGLICKPICALPQVIMEKYPVFRLDILIRTLIIYSLPLVLFRAAKRLGLLRN